MKKAFIFNFLLLIANTAYAQEESTVDIPPFWGDSTFLMLAGGAVFLIVLLIVKKVLEKRADKAYEEEGEDLTEDDYEDSNL